MSGFAGSNPCRAGFNFAPILAMSEILKLRGAPAFSSSRLARLTDSVKAVLPRLKGLAAEHWYFAEVSAPLTAEELSRLVDLLGVHPEGDAPAGSLLMVTPRLGTISPWSSKATDIAHQCGFDKIVRVERGIAFSFDLRGGLDARDRDAVLPAIHDRMTESVLENADAAHALFHQHGQVVPHGQGELGLAIQQRQHRRVGRQAVDVSGEGGGGDGAEGRRILQPGQAGAEFGRAQHRRRLLRLGRGHGQHGEGAGQGTKVVPRKDRWIHSKIIADSVDCMLAEA